MQVNSKRFKRYNTFHQSSRRNVQLHRRHFQRLCIYHHCGIGIVLGGKCGALQSQSVVFDNSFHRKSTYGNLSRLHDPSTGFVHRTSTLCWYNAGQRLHRGSAYHCTSTRISFRPLWVRSLKVFVSLCFLLLPLPLEQAHVAVSEVEFLSSDSPIRQRCSQFVSLHGLTSFGCIAA